MKRLVGMLLIALVSVTLPVVSAPEASAQTEAEIPPPVVAMSSDIVTGTVTSTLLVDFGDGVYTVHHIDVESVTKGSAPDSILVQIPGGTAADGSSVWYSHQARFLIDGERVQLALEPLQGELAQVISAAADETAPVYSIIAGDSGGLVARGGASADAIFAATPPYLTSGFSIPSFPRSFRVNPANSGVSTSGTVAAVRRGFDVWENDPLSKIDFTYIGTTTASGAGSDQVATVSWRTRAQEPGLGAASIGITRISRSGSNYEFDIILRNGALWANGSSFGRNEIGTVVAHEVGHGLGLAHTDGRDGSAPAPAVSELMHWQIQTGSVKPLGNGDLAGARALYPDSRSGLEPGHSVAANEAGQVAVAAVQSDGRVFARRDFGSGLSRWIFLGNSDWVAADVTIAPNGTIYVAAVRENGRMHTRRWAPDGTWDQWVAHGTGWGTFSMPSISANASKVVLGGMSETGSFVTRERTSSWGGFTNHGSGWTHGDVDIAADGDIWFAGIKTNGSLQLRNKISGGWSSFTSQGLPTWTAATAPSIAAHANGVVYGAIKGDGRLYTRHYIGGQWRGFVRHGTANWASIDVAVSDSGAASLAAVKDFGRLYMRKATAPGSWQGLSRQGADAWSVPADPSVAMAAGGPVILAVQTSGTMYLRERAGRWLNQGAPDWEIGR